MPDVDQIMVAEGSESSPGTEEVKIETVDHEGGGGFDPSSLNVSTNTPADADEIVTGESGTWFRKAFSKVWDYIKAKLGISAQGSTGKYLDEQGNFTTPSKDIRLIPNNQANTAKIKIALDSSIDDFSWRLSFIVTITTGDYYTKRIAIDGGPGWRYNPETQTETRCWFDTHAILLSDSEGNTTATVRFGYDTDNSQFWVGFDGYGTGDGVTISDVTAGGSIPVTNIEDIFIITTGSSLPEPDTTITAEGVKASYAATAGSATDSTKVAKAGDTMSGTLNAYAENNVAIGFRNNASYYTTASYQTAGNEALVFATKNSLTSFMFVNGEDSVANHASNRWQSLTPALQIKENKVAIGKLIANGAGLVYPLEVNGDVSATNFRGTLIGNATNVTGTVAIGHGGTGATTAANARTNLGTPYMTTETYPALVPTNGSNNWIKIGTKNSNYGLLPSQSGGAGSGHNNIGTSSWYWKYAYIDTIYGYLSGKASNATNADYATSASSATTSTTASALVDNGWKQGLVNSQNATYYRKIGNIVFIHIEYSGFITAQTWIAYFTLPSGYRPSKAINNSYTCSGAGNVLGIVRVQTDGVVSLFAGGTAGTNVLYGWGEISFAV